MRTRIAILIAAAAVSGAAPARAQNPTLDARWLAYVGCWRSIEVAREATVCLVPGGQPSAIDLVTIDSGRVVAAEQIVTNRLRAQTTRGDCTGWESAQWSEVSDRVYLRSEETCPGWGTRTGTGLIALTHEGHLLYVQGNRVAVKTGVRVQRYREAGGALDLPSEVRDALQAASAELTATARARAAATAALEIEDLAEASRVLDAEVVEAWLIARGGAFDLDAKRLVALANAGVPSRITDLMIALSNPSVFVVNANARVGARRVTTSTDSNDIGPVGAFPQFSGASCDLLYYGYYGIFSSSPYCGYASMYPYAFGWYPVTIIYTGIGSSGGAGGGSSDRSHGRVVNGRGYQEGLNTDAARVRTGEPRSTSIGTATSAPSASASAGEQRTAKPRP